MACNLSFRLDKKRRTEAATIYQGSPTKILYSLSMVSGTESNPAAIKTLYIACDLEIIRFQRES